MKVIKKTRRRKSNPVSVTDHKLYTGELPLPEMKKKDLLNLCRQNIIPSVYHGFFDNLSSSTQILDSLPEPDEEEEPVAEDQ